MFFVLDWKVTPLVSAEPHEPNSKMGDPTTPRDPLGPDKDFPLRNSNDQACCHVCGCFAQHNTTLINYHSANIYIVQTIDNRGLHFLDVIAPHPSLLMSSYESHAIVPGLQDVGDSEEVKKRNPLEVAKRKAFQKTITEAAKQLGISLSEKHELSIRNIPIPSNRTLQIGPPKNLKGEMVLGIWYLTNNLIRIDGKEEKGPATILLRRDGAPFSRVQITVDDDPEKQIATSIIASEV